MKCPICKKEAMSSDTQRWGPEFAHTQCVNAYSLGYSDARAAVEAALRDAPQADGWVMVPVEPTDKMMDAMESCSDDWPRTTWVKAWQAAIAATPSAPTAVEPDERALSHELIKVAAWLLSPEPTRQIDRLEDQTHIGHRQFESAQEAMRETLRNKAFEIRHFVDAARASKGTK